MAISGAKSGGSAYTACEDVRTHVLWGPFARSRVGRYSSTRCDTWREEIDSPMWSPRAANQLIAASEVSRGHVGQRHVTLLRVFKLRMKLIDLSTWTYDYSPRCDSDLLFTELPLHIFLLTSLVMVSNGGEWRL